MIINFLLEEFYNINTFSYDSNYGLSGFNYAFYVPLRVHSTIFKICVLQFISLSVKLYLKVEF